MFSQAEFLEQEIDRLVTLLNSSLRFDYVEDVQKFYDEFAYRLKWARDELSIAENQEEFDRVTLILNELSELIVRIERSKVGEFSWTFSYSFKKLVSLVCQENFEGTDYEPLFFISSGGGLDAYEIVSLNEVSNYKHPAYNIIFPASRKEEVLLHSILGHEVAHAAFEIPAYNEVFREIIGKLLRGSELRDAKAFQAWAQENEPSWRSLKRKDAAIIRDDWTEEIFCDLFGLVTMGPSFLAAHRSLLETVSPNGVGRYHPPSKARFSILLAAYEHLALDEHLAKDSEVSELVENFRNQFQILEVQKLGIRTNRIQDAVDEITQVLVGEDEKIVCSEEDLSEVPKIVSDLRKNIPPTKLHDGEYLINDDLDMRAILYGGWLYALQEKNRFKDINRLCNLSILHQESIRVWNSEMN